MADGVADGKRDAQVVTRLELLEERVAVQIERVPVGAVIVRREVVRRTETLSVELRRETLILRREPPSGDAVHGAQIIVDGQVLAPGEEIRVVVYDERAEAVVRPVVAEVVEISKVQRAEPRTLAVDLGREVLRVDTEGDARVVEGR